MAISRYDPFESLAPLRETVNRLIEDSFLGMGRFEVFGRAFPLDIREAEGEYVVEAAIPGVKPEDIKVTASGNALTIFATRKREEKTEKPDFYVRRERYEGEMSRVIELPVSIDATRVTAAYENGVLVLRVPKTQKTEPKQIPVQVREPKAGETH